MVYPLSDAKISLVALLIFGILLGAVVPCMFPSVLGINDQRVRVLKGSDDLISLLDGANKSIDIDTRFVSDRTVMRTLKRCSYKNNVTVRVVCQRYGEMEDNMDIGEIRLKILSPPPKILEGYEHVEVADYDVYDSRLILIDGKMVVCGSYDLSWKSLHECRKFGVVIEDRDLYLDAYRHFLYDWERA